MSADFELLKAQKGGTFTTSEANEYGISNERLRLLVKSGLLERASYGVYITPEEFEDRMFIVQKRRPKIIYSHETALYFHDLTDRTPHRYTVTVPTGYNTTTLRNDNFKVFTIKPELYETGITDGKTMFGH
ncbi:MAG: type IV toxin-antitoxin system AbiEi family antitoxin domain-containing protein, partial [Ruminococcus sp.]|nr:type IV toxin-antitoxin system AbiEi family antitoxin domain-containing protein [Ruminococcus sp.]